MSTVALKPLPLTEEATELMKQLRTECGWDADKVPHWVQQARDGHRINLSLELSPENVTIGMMSLVLEDDEYDLNVDKCLANPLTKTAMIKSLFVRHSYQRKGYGKQAILKLEEFAAAKYGIEILALDTDAGDANNMAMYPRIGYSEFRERIPCSYSEAGPQMSTVFTILTQAVLVLEVAFYFGTLISPTFLAATQRRAIIKSVRNVIKLKPVQIALTVAFSVTVLLFLESLVSLKPLLQDYHGYVGGSADGKLLVLLKVHRTEKNLTTSGFVLMMAIAIFMRLREKNNYIKLLEKYENKPEGEDHHEDQGEFVEVGKKPEQAIVSTEVGDSIASATTGPASNEAECTTPLELKPDDGKANGE
ncbi:hypothetical protein BDR26DRAFT_922630 [Obelidium mucronatum]|nr:hypothetical protein BDR26DRAFT_922630 [Obelidium mucronatum]